MAMKMVIYSYKPVVSTLGGSFFGFSSTNPPLFSQHLFILRRMIFEWDDPTGRQRSVPILTWNKTDFQINFYIIRDDQSR